MANAMSDRTVLAKWSSEPIGCRHCVASLRFSESSAAKPNSF